MIVCVRKLINAASYNLLGLITAYANTYIDTSHSVMGSVLIWPLGVEASASVSRLAMRRHRAFRV